MECMNCALVYLWPQPSKEELVQYYTSETTTARYAESPMSSVKYAEARYGKLIKLLSTKSTGFRNPTRGRLLDIGCGNGEFLQVASEHGWLVSGTELSPSAVCSAARVVGGQIYGGDIEALNLKGEQFDLITMYHVIEHLLDPVATLAELRRLLKKGGWLFVETPNIHGLGARIKGKAWSSICPPEHIVYFNQRSLRHCLSEAGFAATSVCSAAPQTISSIDTLPLPVKHLGSRLYKIAPWFGLGAVVEAVAVK